MIAKMQGSCVVCEVCVGLPAASMLVAAAIAAHMFSNTEVHAVWSQVQDIFCGAMHVV